MSGEARQGGRWRREDLPGAVRSFAARIWRGRGPADGPEWGAAVRGIERGLAGLSGSEEGVFLRTGERLMEMQVQAREIAGQAGSMAELLSNDGGSLVVLDALLRSAGEDRVEHVVESAGAVEENALAIHRAVESFDRLVNTFDVLGMMTRVESARLEGMGGTFAGLADTVMGLSKQIREHIGASGGSAKALLETTVAAGREMRRVSEVRRRNLGPLTRQASGSIQEIAARRARAVDVNAQLASRFEGVSQAMGDLVEALQSHDIVRQQIEHVAEALQRAEDSGGSEAGRQTAMRLQAAQVENARTTFERSVQQVGSALGRIERSIEEIAEEAASLVAPSDGENEASFVSGLESSMAGILTVVESNAGADRLLAEAVASIGERVCEIAKTMAGVQTIGIEMHRIASNATIQAAHLGGDGGALEVVANSVQGLAREASTASRTIEERLNGIRDAASALEEAATGGSSASQAAELRGSTAGLQSIQRRARDGYALTVERIGGLKQQIAETIAEFGDRSEMVEGLGRAARELRELSGDGRAAAASDVEQLAAAYSMQSERDVHNALFETADAGGRQLAAVSEGARPDGQDDNVEFF